MVSDIERWPQRLDTVVATEPLTEGPLGKGSHVRVEQPRLPKAVWTVDAWNPPADCVWSRPSGGLRIVADHRVAALGDARGD